MNGPTVFGGLGAVLLIALLVVREIAAASPRPQLRLFARYLSIALLPLILVFLVNVAATLYDLVI